MSEHLDVTAPLAVAANPDDVKTLEPGTLYVRRSDSNHSLVLMRKGSFAGTFLVAEIFCPGGDPGRASEYLHRLADEVARVPQWAEREQARK